MVEGATARKMGRTTQWVAHTTRNTDTCAFVRERGGGGGNDLLTGGDGADRFVFDTILGDSNTDTITDFVTKTDKIVLSAKVFSAFKGSSAGLPITTGNLVVGTGVSAVAKDKDDYLIYDTTSDLLYYDADGNGTGSAVAFVKIELTGTSAPAFGDFVVVS